MQLVVHNTYPLVSTLDSVQDTLVRFISISDLKSIISALAGFVCLWLMQTMTREAQLIGGFAILKMVQRLCLALLAMGLIWNSAAPFVDPVEHHDLLGLMVQIPLLGLMLVSGIIYRIRRGRPLAYSGDNCDDHVSANLKT